MSAPTIETARLRLRPWTASDRAPWAAMSGDPRVMEYFPRTLDRTEADDLADYFARRLDEKGYGFWVVEVDDAAPFAGVLALIDVPFEAHFTPALEVGWRLATAFWGRGYATEGARALLEFAFASLGRDEVVAMTAAINLRSQSVMKRLAMTRDPADDFSNPRVAPGSPLRPHVLYRIKRAAYEIDAAGAFARDDASSR